MYVLTPPTQDSVLYRRLLLKLEEYKERMRERPWQNCPDSLAQHFSTYRDASYKAHVLYLVLIVSPHRVHLDGARDALLRRYGVNFDPKTFERACLTIKYYTEGRVVPNGSGTGLP
jgi:hypothetical protein